MSVPTYINLAQARKVLAEMGIELSLRQVKRAAEQDAQGRRKLPFFVDPIDKKLKIEKGDLVRIYQRLQTDANNNLRD
ncbi:MAG: hypothetical protein KDK89_21405 [Alphaproteobacteria bacterium]|nr:hypothetical protein [Alphaproteobacteria bacterium]